MIFDRIIREAESLAKVDHPNIVTIFDVDKSLEGEPLIIMEYVEGPTLRQWISEGEHSLSDILRVFIQAGRALQAAHEIGVIHRDFKPDNVFVTSGPQAKLGDFGLAGGAKKSSPNLQSLFYRRPYLTTVGTIMGTPGYMAPEQWQGQNDARSDQFAFCVSLWEAVSGSLPFAIEEIRNENVEGYLDSMRAPTKLPGADTIPLWLRRILLKGLSHSPSNRHESVEALVDDVERGIKRRHSTIRLFLTVALAAILFGLIAWTITGRISIQILDFGLGIATASAVAAIVGIWLKRKEEERARNIDEATLAVMIHLRSSQVLMYSELLQVVGDEQVLNGALASLARSGQIEPAGDKVSWRLVA